MKEDAPEPGRLSLATAMAFALAVAAARGETAVAGLLAGILALAEDGRLDELVDPLVAHFQAEKLKQELAKRTKREEV